MGERIGQGERSLLKHRASRQKYNTVTDDAKEGFFFFFRATEEGEKTFFLIFVVVN